jgi:hypothetical protein
MVMSFTRARASGNLQINCDSETDRGGKIVAVGLLLAALRDE